MNQPLNHVLVTISYTQRRQRHFSYITDTDGRFTFPESAARKMGPYRGKERLSDAVLPGQ